MNRHRTNAWKTKTLLTTTGLELMMLLSTTAAPHLTGAEAENTAAPGSAVLRCDYPGGNVKINSLQPGRAEIEADLRGNAQPWFYWNFEAKAEKPGTVKFLFPVNRQQLSAQGPAISTDGGSSWRWLGKENSSFLSPEPEGKRDSFIWNFSKAGETVRFAQGIPYQKADLDAFLKKQQGSPYLESSILPRTLGGRETPLLKIMDKSGDSSSSSAPKRKILLSARHHACEAIASRVMEGFLEEALSDSEAGKRFREKFILYAVPFVDLDGVESGDQGKGRKPFDHNRDYGLETQRYPETRAILELQKKENISIGLDLHAPSVRNDIHEAFYFDGLRTPSNQANTQEFALWIAEESPRMIGNTLNLLKAKKRNVSASSGTSFAHYFAEVPEMIYAVTIECPYANSNPDYDAEAAKEYGRGLLRAMLHMDFRKSPEKHKNHEEFRNFCRSLNGAPNDLIRKAEDILKAPDSPPLYKEEAKLRLGWLYPRMKKWDAAVRYDDEVLRSGHATARQKADAAVQKTEALCRNPDTTDETLDSWIREMDSLRLSGRWTYQALDALYARAMEKKNPEKALDLAEKQLHYAGSEQKGKIRNRIASYYFQKGEKEKAAEYSRETAAGLRSRLIPKMPVGVFGPTQAEDLVNALRMIPETQTQEIVDAANLALNHKYCPPDVRKRLSALIESIQSGTNTK